MKYLALTFAFALGLAVSAHAETPTVEHSAIASRAVLTGGMQAQTLKAASQPTKTPAKGKKKKKKKKAPTHHA